MSLEGITIEISLADSIRRSLDNIDNLETIIKDLNTIKEKHVPVNNTNKVYIKVYIPKEKTLLFQKRVYHVTDFNNKTPHGNKDYSAGDLHSYK